MRLFLLSLSLLFITSCSMDDQETKEPQQIDFKIASALFQSKGTTATASCHSSDLIAGQNIVVGTVDVHVDGSVITITYNTIPGWTIDQTHMSLGNCTDDIPTTGSGNPKVGHFEYSATHGAGTQVVTYTADSSTLPAQTCIAAHAVVSSASGQTETAWGAGLDFPGRSWATYMELDMLTCGSGGAAPDETR